MTGRDLVLERIRSANRQAHADATIAVQRRYRVASGEPGDRDELIDLFVDRLVDYRADVHRCQTSDIASTIANVVSRAAIGSVVVPDGVPESWMTTQRAIIHRDAPPIGVDRLDTLDAAITTATIAIADTGTIVLDASPGQGRRALTLLPDHHLVVLFTAQIVRAVPDALTRLDPTRPQTWISGPSATSDIELIRIEGVHGPRHLHVIIATPETVI